MNTESGPLPRKPGLQIGQRGLTVLLGIVFLCPILVVLILTAILPTAHDRPLAVTASVVVPAEGEPVLSIHNTGPDDLQALRIELNEAYAYLPQARLEAGKTVDIPLSLFAKKTGQHLVPGSTDIRAIHISARLPGNQRALFRQHLPTAP